MAVVEDHLVIRGRRVPLRRIAQPEALRAWVAANGLDGALVSPPPPLYRPELGRADRRRWTALLNDSLAAACADTGDVLRPLAYLPTEDPPIATAVAASLDEAFAGVVMGTELAGGSYADAALDDLWQALVTRQLPVLVHPGACPDKRMEAFYLSNLVGNPVETSIAAAQIIFGGVLDRFPDLRIVLSHGGGAVPAMVGRWDRGHAARRPGVPELSRPPSDVVRQLYVDSLVHDSAALRHVLTTFGDEQVVFGSDWPFPMGADSMADSLSGLRAAHVAAVSYGNATRLLWR